MTITGTFMDKATANISSQSQNTSMDTSFGETFEKVSSKKESSYAQSIAEKKRAYNKANNSPKKADDSKSAYNKSKADSNDVERKTTENSQKTEASNKTKPTDENKKTEEKVVEEVASSLGISSEALLDMLAKLNIQPADLADVKNVNLLVQEILGAESPVELLSMEGVKDLFSKIEGAVEKAQTGAIAEEAFKIAGEGTEADILEQAGDETDLTAEPGEANVHTTVESGAKAQAQSNETGTESDEGGQSSLFGEANMDIEIDASLSGQYVESTTTTAFASQRTETARAANPQEITSQIIERVKVDIKPGVSEIHMNLRPESLGEVSLRIASENGIVIAHFVAENEKVKEIIESNFNQLQDALSEQGVNITELSVSIASGNNERQMQEFIQGRAKSQSRISSIISAIGEDGEIIPTEPDEAEIYENNVNYKV